MKSRLRAGIAAATVLIASCGAVAATNQTASAMRVSPEASKVAEAGSGTELPAGTAGDLIVDDSHSQVFVSMPTINTIVVTNPDGHIQRTVTGVLGPRKMALSPDGSTLYATERSSSSIARIDTSSYEVAHTPLPTDTCPISMAFTGGSLWFTYQPGSCSYYGTTSLGRIDPATGDVHLDLAAVPAASFPYALSDRPDRMILQNNLGRLSVYDVSGHSPALVAQRSHSVSRPDCRGAVLLAGGEKVITACNYADKAEVFYTADLSEAPALVPGSGPYALAVSADGRQIATAWGASDGCHLRVWDIKASTPGSFVGSYGFDPSFYSPGFAFAYSATGRLYAVRSVGDQNAVLRVVSEPAKCPTKPTLEINRKAVPYQGTAGAFGSLRHSPGGPTTAALTRTDRTGSHDLGTVPVNADGTFRLTDTPGVTGAVVYSVSYAGDETHGPGGAKAVAFVHPLAYDVNADNRADAIVGVPGEDLGSTSNAGMFHLLYGTASGVSGSGSKVYHQSTAGVPGVPEAGDQFGYANASGDFNADGYADVAVSAPAEDLSSTVDAGGVWVFYGSSAGLRTDNITTLTLDHTYLRGTPGVRFGHALASGDFDADGRDDLAIGAPGGEAVFVAPGSETGLSRDHIDNFDENTPDVPGVKRSGDWFGWSLAALNVNGDTHSDLAVGAPYDSDDHGYATGSVTVLGGSYKGLVGVAWMQQRWTKDSPGVPGAPAAFGTDSPDRFGHSLAFVDMTGDGFDELAIGAPGAPAVGADGVTREDAGTVTVLYSNSGTIDTTHGIAAIEVTQLTTGAPGNPGESDQFGTTLAAGDTDRDGKAELAVYSPGDTLVSVVPGGANGLVWSKAKGWTQNSSGIPGSTETGDKWGDSLRFADIKGTGYHALIVGAPGENSRAGAITVIYAASTGLTGTGAKYFSQNSSGISGTAESGDAFGTFH